MKNSRQILIVLACAMAVLGLAACSSDDASDDTSSDTSTSTTTAAGDDDGIVVTEPGPIELAVGERATIRLEANPTTGYQWEPTSAPDDTVITVISDRYEAADSNVVGSGGQQDIVIEAVGAGETTFELRYVRPWEDGGEPAETASYTVTVS